MTERWRRRRLWAGDLAHAGVRQLRSLRGAEPTAAHGGVQALLIPGVWEPWRYLAPLASRLRERGLDSIVVPSLGYHTGTVTETAALVRARLAACHGTVVLVAHSKGGLVGKRVLLDWIVEPASDRVTLAGLVAVSTPWRGSRLARRLPWRSIAELRDDAAPLASLADETAADARIVAIHPSWDPHVPEPAPPEAAAVVRVPVEGHFRVLDARETVDAVVDGVRALAASA